MNKDKVSAAKKASYLKNKQYYLDKVTKYREENPEVIKTWRKKNKESISQYNNRYVIERIKIDPIFKLRCHVRKMICKAIARGGYIKNSRTEEILGCSFNEFQKYIQDKFLSGMYWNNHGAWHIDHKMPLASAKSEEELIKLNHFTNLQPLWAKDNLAKGTKIYAI